MSSDDQKPEKDWKGLTVDEWRKLLTNNQYYILRDKGTERAFTGEYWNHFEEGMYICAGCGTKLFDSDSKFDSDCGWPSFSEPVDNDFIKEEVDTSFGMRRTEVLCKNCGGHLGHVFNDGPKERGGLRYCINSPALKFTEIPSDPQE
jgi:peptide-methionine (R)-S-oxide reductase